MQVTPATNGTVYGTFAWPGFTEAVEVVKLPGCAGAGLTVMVIDVLFVHPLVFLTVYVIVTLPAETPVTIPVLPTVAIAVEELLQVPPVVRLVKEVVLPAHTELAPVMAAGAAGLE